MRIVSDKLLTWMVSVPWRTPFVSISVMWVIGAIKLLVAMLLLHDPWKHEALLVIDAAISGVLAGAMVWILLSLVRARRRRIIEYVRRVADLNHHIRNALQIILYQASLAKSDPKQIDQVEKAVRRVDAALTEIFPILGDRKSDPKSKHDLIY